MISQLKGTLIEKTPTEIVVDCGGVGYSALVSVRTSDELPKIGENVTIKTLLIPRDDALNLFGFLTEMERNTFKLLISISGIGPKMAIGILSSVAITDFQEYIASGNANAITKLPGIGKKTAQRLILELKDKINLLGGGSASVFAKEQNLIKQEALSALITLGYSRAVAEKSIKRAIDELGSSEITAEILIRNSLKFALK